MMPSTTRSSLRGVMCIGVSAILISHRRSSMILPNLLLILPNQMRISLPNVIRLHSHSRMQYFNCQGTTRGHWQLTWMMKGVPFHSLCHPKSRCKNDENYVLSKTRLTAAEAATLKEFLEKTDFVKSPEKFLLGK